MNIVSRSQIILRILIKNQWSPPGPPVTLKHQVSTFFFFQLKEKLFNWRITTLQYYVGFCHTSTWITHRYTYVPSLSPHLSPPLSQRTSFVSYREFPLAIYFTHLCFRVNSFNSSLLFPYCVHKSVLYACISIATLQTDSLGLYLNCSPLNY